MVGLAPGLGLVTGSPGRLRGACVAVSLGGVHHGRCARAMARGLEMRVLEVASAVGCRFWVCALDSWMGTVHGICP